MDLGRKYGQRGILYKGHGDDSAKFIYTSQDLLGQVDDLV